VWNPPVQPDLKRALSKTRIGPHPGTMLRCLCFYAGLLVICMLTILSAYAHNQSTHETHHGDEAMLGIDANGIFKDPGVVQLAQAAAGGDVQTVHDLVRQGVDVNARGDLNTSLLEWAFLHKSIVGMQALLETGADPAQAKNIGYAMPPKQVRELMDSLSSSSTDEDSILARAKAAGIDPAMQFRIALLSGASVYTDALTFDVLGTLGDVDKSLTNLIARYSVTQSLLQGISTLLKAGADPNADEGNGQLLRYYLDAMQNPELASVVALGTFIEDKRELAAWLAEHEAKLDPSR